MKQKSLTWNCRIYLRIVASGSAIISRPHTHSKSWLHLVCHSHSVEAEVISNTLSKQRSAHVPRACATRHRWHVPGTDPSGLLLGKLSCPEGKLELNVRRRTQRRERQRSVPESLTKKNWGKEEKPDRLAPASRAGRGFFYQRKIYRERCRRDVWINGYYPQPLEDPWQPYHFSPLSSSSTERQQMVHRHHIWYKLKLRTQILFWQCLFMLYRYIHQWKKAQHYTF